MNEQNFRALIREILMEVGFIPDYKKKEYNDMISKGFRIMKGEDKEEDNFGEDKEKDKSFNKNGEKERELSQSILNIKGEKDGKDKNKIRFMTPAYKLLAAIYNWINNKPGSYEAMMKYRHNSSVYNTYFKKMDELKASIRTHGSDTYSKFRNIVHGFFLLLRNKKMIEERDFDWLPMF